MEKRLPRIIEMVEWAPKVLNTADFTDAEISHIAETASRRVKLTWSKPRDFRVELLSQGWVGTVQCGQDLVLRVRPKFRLSRIFQLVRWTAYDEDMHRGGYVPAGKELDVNDFIMDRFLDLVQYVAATGLHKDYQRRSATGVQLRGRINIRKTLALHARGKPQVAYEENVLTPDLAENRVVLWTANVLLSRTGGANKLHASLSEVYSSLAKWITLLPSTADDCRSFVYDVRNERYRELHELCALVLEGCSPEHQFGSESTPSFGISTSKLFELAVAKCLESVHDTLTIGTQVELKIGPTKFVVDNVVRRGNGREVAAIVDAKYKDPTNISSDDVQQVVAYATALQTSFAILVYPTSEGLPGPFRVGAINVVPLALDLTIELNEAAISFRGSLSSLLIDEAMSEHGMIVER